MIFLWMEVYPEKIIAMRIAWCEGYRPIISGYTGVYLHQPKNCYSYYWSFDLKRIINA